VTKSATSTKSPSSTASVSRTITATRTVARRRALKGALAAVDEFEGDPSASPSPRAAASRAAAPPPAPPRVGVRADASRRSWLSFFYALGGARMGGRDDAAAAALRAGAQARAIDERAEEERALREQAEAARAAVAEQE